MQPARLLYRRTRLYTISRIKLNLSIKTQLLGMHIIGKLAALRQDYFLSTLYRLAKTYPNERMISQKTWSSIVLSNIITILVCRVMPLQGFHVSVIFFYGALVVLLLQGNTLSINRILPAKNIKVKTIVSFMVTALFTTRV